MMRFFLSCGIWAWPILVMAIAILVLAVRKSVELYGSAAGGPGLDRGLHAILFWGAMSAVTGVLGQASGIYNAMRAISRADAVSPPIVAMGIAESFTSTIFGLTVFILAAIIWFVLYTRYRRLDSGLA